LQKHLWARLEQSIPHVLLNGPLPGPERLCTNLNISFEFVEGEGVVLMADMQGVSMASGAACVSKALKASPVLTAMGVPNALAQGNVIITMGKDNSNEDIDYAAQVISKVVEKLRGMSPTWDEYQKGLAKSLIRPR
jgi:cysteine desulfurase